MNEKIYWNEFFDIVCIKKKIANAHDVCVACRDMIKTWSIITQKERGNIELAYADMRDNLSIIRSLVSKYALKFNEIKSKARKSLKGTYATKTEEDKNIVKDTEELVYEDYKELEEEKNYVDEVEYNIRTHIRMCEYFKSAVIWERADAKRMDTMLSTWDFD